MCSAQVRLKRMLVEMQKAGGRFRVQEGPSGPKNVRRSKLSDFSQEKSESFETQPFLVY